MKAVVMAGGEGSRLRPLTCDIPKPMARLCGKPILEYIFDLLLRNGVTEAALTLGYLPNVIMERFPDGEYKGLRLTFVTEETPLGTAGGVKNAARGFTEPFIVISGDAMCDFELEKIVRYHNSAGAAVTIAGSQVEDPREYGLIKIADDGLVLGFIEKPSWGQAITDLANTGIYIVNPECLSMISQGVPFDFAKDLFPKMMEKKLPLYCYNATGYWCDIGDIKAYLKCQRDLLGGRINYPLNAVAGGVYVKDKLPKGDYSIIPPVYIGEQTDIGASAIIGPGAVIDDECLIGERTRIGGSVVLRGASVMRGGSVTDALICDRAMLKNDVTMYEGSVAGKGSVIGAGATLKPDALVWPEKLVEEYATVSGSVKFGTFKREIFEDTGIGGLGGIELTPETCASIGAAIGSVKSCKKAGVASDGTNNAKAMTLALMAGMMSAGCHVWSFGECFEAQLSFCTSFCGLGAGIFVSGGKEPQIKICGEGGLSIPRYLEREIESRVSKGEFSRCQGESCKDIADMSSINMMYSRELLKQAPYELKGALASVKCSEPKITMLIEDMLGKLGCAKGGAVLKINAAGTSLSAQTETGTSIPFEKLLAICCYNELQNGKDIALPFDAPLILDTLAASCGRKAYRYLSTPADNSDSVARRLSAKQIWVRDALFMAVRLLSIVKEREKSLDKLYGELPEFYLAKKTFTLHFPPSRLAEFFDGDTSAEVESGNPREGILVRREKGSVMITPSKSGKAVRVIAEADNMETAQELCASLEELGIRR